MKQTLKYNRFLDQTFILPLGPSLNKMVVGQGSVISGVSNLLKNVQTVEGKSHMTTQQRGLHVNIGFAVFNFMNFFYEQTSSTVDINDMAVIVFKVQPVTIPENHVDVKIKFTKSEAAKEKNLPVLINIFFDELKKQFLCQDEWTEVLLTTKMYSTSDDAIINGKPFYYFTYYMQVNITACTLLPTCSYMYDELYEETESLDFQLQGTDGSVPVHKCVLCVHSKMFRTMFGGEWKETEENTINMPGETVQTLQQLKDYMYLGKVPDKGLEPLLLLARRCLMNKLAASCIEKLISSVKPDTIDGLVEFACQHNIPRLVKELLLGAPDDVVNGISMLSIDEKKSDDTK